MSLATPALVARLRTLANDLAAFELTFSAATLEAARSERELADARQSAASILADLVTHALHIWRFAQAVERRLAGAMAVRDCARLLADLAAVELTQVRAGES